MIYWFTGQPGAGKTTLALALRARLRSLGIPVVHFDGEELRKITGNVDLSSEGRVRNVRLAQALCLKLQEEGVVAIASFVSPNREVRELLKVHPGVLEVYVHTSAIRGKEGYFVRDYEPPAVDFLDLDTTGVAVESCVDRIVRTGTAKAEAAFQR